VAGTSNGRMKGAIRSRRAIRAGVAMLVTVAFLTGVMFLAPIAQARTEVPVTVGPAEVSTALFVAGDVARLSRVPAGTEDLVLEKALQQMYADEPELAPATAEGYVGDMQALLAASTAPSQASLQLMAGNQRIIAILAALERPYGSPSAELPAAAKLAVTHLAAVALSGSSDIFAGAEEPRFFEPLADARTNLVYTSFAPATVLRATRALAAANRRFGEARDDLWAKASEESVFSQWSELLNESKALQAEGLKEVREKIEAGKGTITAEPQALTALFTKGQARTQEQSCERGAGEEPIGAETIPGIPRLKCSGGALYEAAHARACGEKAKCEAELAQLQADAPKQARVIAEERAEMIAAAELLRPSDNTAAALQQATAQAQAQITEEETAYANYEAEQAEKEAIAGGVKEGLGIGTSALALGTGNYSEGIGGLIGVGFELYENIEGALSNPPPGPQEITLQDLADLSTQLSGFQQYTQEAFHAINTQLAQLSSQLARENYELEQHLSELGERLQKEQSTIFALQDEVQTLFAAQTKANLQSTIEDSVGWLERTGEPLSGPKVQEALIALKKYATEIANGALVNNAETQPYNFEGAFRQLTDKATGEPTELSEDITYLGRFPAEQGWGSFALTGTLANTTFWSESSRAYAQLMLENATHATAADVAGLKELEKEGVKLEKVAAAWSEPSNPVLNKALAAFEAAAYGGGVDGTRSIQAILNEEAEGSMEKWLERYVKTGSALGNPTNVKLWGGAEQPFSGSAVAGAKYPALKWKECSGSAGGNGSVEMPERFIASLPAALVNGIRLGVIGAPGSGDQLILEACRNITSSSSVGKTEERTGEEACGEGYTSETCQDVYENEIKSETQPETVSETFTLKDGEGGSTLTASSVGSCSQTGLFWTGVVHGFSRDPTDETFNGAVEKYQELNNKSFSGRHVGSAFELSASGNKVGWKYNTTPFEGAACPYEGSEEKTGVEFADYQAAAKPLGSSAESTILEDVQVKLSELQQEAYGAGLHALGNPTKGNPLESLAGARALVQGYVKLGFPQALASDLSLQSDIEGLGAQFLDPEPGSPRPLPAQVSALVANWISRLKGATGSQLGQLLQEDLIGEVEARSLKWAKEVAEQIKPYVEGKATGFDTGAEEKVGEQSALVESTLNRLQLTRDVLTEARAPTAETLAPSGVGTTEATVRGEVEPNGGVVESCVFEYGASESYGHSVPCSTIPDANEKAVVVSAKIADWTPEGSFHERVVMKTWGGASYGEDVKVQLAQSTDAPSGGLILANTSTSGATIGGFIAEELPFGAELPAGAVQIVGSLSFTVNVAPGGSARVKITLPGASAPNALFKLRHVSGREEYVEIPSSLYTINGNTIELTLVDGGPDDEDGEVNGVIVDPLVPVVMTKQPGPSSSASTSSPQTAAAGTPSSTKPATPAKQIAPRECVSNGSVTVHLSDLKLPRGATIEHSEILVGGRVVARLGGSATAAVVSFAGLRKGHYEVTLVAKLSNGKTLRRRIAFHPCGPAALTARQCVSNGSVTVHVSDLKLPRGATVEQSEILAHGRLVARLGSRATAAVVSFAGQHSGPYEVTLLATLRDRRTLRRKVLFGACSAGRR
jgi:hypothetical protein